MKRSVHESLNLPESAPVMVLPNAVLVPNALLPLHIFEPQYREMLRQCLERDRLFCVAMRRPGAAADEPENYVEVAGVGLVRACVGAEDGTSNLILQGLLRVRLGKVVEMAPYRVVELREFETSCPNLVEAEALGTKVVEICSRLQQQGQSLPEALVDKLRQVTSPEMLADIVTQTFLRDPMRQQDVMEEAEVSERLRMLIRLLKPEIAV